MDLRSGDPDTDNPGRGDEWPDSRRVRAEVVAALLLGAVEQVAGCVAGLRMAGAVVVGTVDVRGGVVGYAAVMTDCCLADGLVLAEATTRTVDLSGSILGDLDARLAVIGGHLVLDRCKGREIDLREARINGSVSLLSAHLANPGGDVLNADVMTVDGDMDCRQGFQAEGGVALVGAHIGGALNLDGARLANPGGDALIADRMTVRGAMFCGAEFQAEGMVRLLGVHIGDQLGFRDVTLSNGGQAALVCEGLEADALWLEFRKVTGTVDLIAARVKALYDQPGYWPVRLRLDGLSYDDLRPYAPPEGPAGRLAWLSRDQDGYRAQPYEQLAAYYRRLGHDAEARKVLVAKQRRRRAGLSIPGKILGHVLDALVGYGYRPGRALAWLTGLLIAGSAYFTINQPVPADPAHHPHYQPVLYAADLVIPVVNFGQSGAWLPTGAGQWVAAGLTAFGWIFATAVVAGVTRVLTRT